MEARRGHIERGVVILQDPTDAPDGTEVTVIIPNVEQSIEVGDEELRLIDNGLEEARDRTRIDARAFLRELRLGR